MSHVVLDGVSKVYGDGSPAVRDLSLAIEEGEFLVLVGPSGCGKSTALRMVAGLESITSGSLSVAGRVVNDVHPADRDIAMVFQNYALYPHMSVRQNIAFALRMRKTPKAEIDERVSEAARILGLTEWLDKKPGQLSGGQRQRVAMGRAIVRRPAAFLMDEPLSNLDAKLRVQMRAEILRLQRRLGVTTIYVTHDQVEALTMGDRVAVMKRGELQQIADPVTLYDHPCNLFVAAFVGSPAMNLLAGTLVAHGSDGGLAVDLAGQQLVLPASVVAARPALRGKVGAPVTLGVRPENLVVVAGEAPNDGSTLVAEIDLIEALGSDLMLHLRMPGRNVVTDDQAELAEEVGAIAGEGTAQLLARVAPGTPVHTGDRVTLRAQVERLHLFDDDGLAIGT